MKIKLLCPKCKREETLRRKWRWWFKGEDYFDWKIKVAEILRSQWLKEYPEITEKINNYEKEARELEKQLDPEILLELKVVNQQLHFLHNRLANPLLEKRESNN